MLETQANTIKLLTQEIEDERRNVEERDASVEFLSNKLRQVKTVVTNVETTEEFIMKIEEIRKELMI